MSLEAMVWAWRQDVGNPIRKLILLHYADAANPENNLEAWHSAGHIASVCNCSKASAHRHIQALCDAGYLTLVKQSSRVYETNRYRVNVGNVVVQDGPKEPEKEGFTVTTQRSPVTTQGFTVTTQGSCVTTQRSPVITKTVIEPISKTVIEPNNEILLSTDKQTHGLLNEIADRYNRLCTGHIKTRSPQPIHYGRMAAVRKIIGEHPEFANIGIWEWFWSGIDALPFWNGKVNAENGKRFKRNIDYFLQYENFVRVLEEVEALEPDE